MRGHKCRGMSAHLRRTRGSESVLGQFPLIPRTASCLWHQPWGWAIESRTGASKRSKRERGRASISGMRSQPHVVCRGRETVEGMFRSAVHQPCPYDGNNGVKLECRHILSACQNTTPDSMPSIKASISPSSPSVSLQRQCTPSGTSLRP